MIRMKTSRTGRILIVLWGLRKFLSLLCEFITVYVKHIRTRDTKPEKGQVWQEGATDRRIYVKEIFENGVISITNVHPELRGCSRWSTGDDDSDWRHRVKYNLMFLVGRWDERD